MDQMVNAIGGSFGAPSHKKIEGKTYKYEAKEGNIDEIAKIIGSKK